MDIKYRDQTDPKYLWDLTPIYPSDGAWRDALQAAGDEVKALSDLPGTLGASVEALKSGLDRIMSASEKVERVYAYAMLKQSGDGSESAHQEMEARAMSLIVSLETETAFLSPEVLAIDENTLDRYLSDDRLSNYRHMLRNIARARSHTLDKNGEMLLAMMGEVAQTPENVFEMLSNVDMRFEPVNVADGEVMPLTHGSFGVMRSSSDPDVRRQAFQNYFGEYGKYINTIAAIYSGNVKTDCFAANARRYESACAAKLFDGNIPVSLYDGLIESVHAALPTMREYLDLRKARLGVDVLHLYDLYTPIVDDVKVDMPYDRAKQLVLDALKPLGEEYQTLLHRAYDERWIDVYENRGKRSGAFSMGVYGVHPYVLLNYSGELDDAFTLAHELGHSMHSYFSDRANDYANKDYTIFVAEVASTVNEVLLTRYLLSIETDAARRAMLLNHFLESFRTTLFRQTLFAEFERKAHDMYEAGTPLTAETLNKLYHDLNALYYDGCEIDEFCDVEWARIPHFYTSFYVYQYATGFSCAVAIADRILKTGDASDYLRFLTTGGSDYPLNELKIAGVDLNDPATVRDALSAFAGSLEQLNRLLNA